MLLPSKPPSSRNGTPPRFHTAHHAPRFSRSQEKRGRFIFAGKDGVPQQTSLLLCRVGATDMLHLPARSRGSPGKATHVSLEVWQMDDRRFDALARSLASASNRRQVLKGLLGLGGVTAAGAIAPGADAARRPAPTPKPPSCPGQQTWQNGACTCPPNTTGCGPDCCPAGAQCCDNACCYGLCYGEELCCPSSQEWCDVTGECCPPGAICCPGVGCRAPEDCCLPSCDGSTCGSDGCDGTCSCAGDRICSRESCVCPSGTMECPDGLCKQCCEFSNQSEECASTQGGDASCWACFSTAPETPLRLCGPWAGGCTTSEGIPGGTCGPEDHICYPPLS